MIYPYTVSPAWKVTRKHRAAFTIILLSMVLAFLGMRVPDLGSKTHHRAMGPRAITQEATGSCQEDSARPVMSATGPAVVRPPSPAPVTRAAAGLSSAVLLPSAPPPGQHASRASPLGPAPQTFGSNTLVRR